jgi:hypothetical protein
MTWAVVALGVAAASAAAGAYSAYQSAGAAKDQANYNAQVSELNAQDARRAGDEEAAKVRRQNAQLAAAQRAGFSAKGIDFENGSAGDALDQTDFFGQVDQTIAKQNAARQAWNLRAQKNGYEYQAAVSRPGMAAGLSLLGSASSVASKWYGGGGAKPAKG